MNTAGLAPDLVMLAATLEDRAGRIESLADELAGRAGVTSWQGPAADRFRSTVTERRQQMRTAADHLRAAARQARLLAATAMP